MKKIKFLLLVLSVSLFNAPAFCKQTYDTSTIDGLYSYIFALLDKTQVPTQYLEEYGAPIVPLASYNGVLSTDNNIGMTLWRTLYWQMNTAYVGTGTNSFVSPRTMNTILKSNLTDGGATPVVVLFANYNNVKSNAFSSNLLTVTNNQVKDVPGRSTSPYQGQTLFAACPAVNTTSTGNATFIFKTDLRFTNSAAVVTSFYVDFADGIGYRAAGWNTPITTSYADTGTKKIKIKMLLSNGVSYECYSNYYVAKASQSASRYSDESYDFSQLFQKNSVHSGGTAFVEYSTANKTTHKITKPFIVIEGYDIASAAPDLRKERTSYKDLMTDFNNAKLQGYDFNQQLDEVGNYDLIFIQFNVGTDDIKRNAALVKEIIQWVNTQKQTAGSVQQNVVMGESMGGLIARYALADMTKARGTGTASTQTRLLISHDSPHRGANFPLGLQYVIQMAGRVHLFGNDIRDVFASYDEVIGLLDQTGSQQMILYRSTGETTCAANTFLDGEYRTMITFTGTDPVPSYQFVATSMGSECANPLYPAYQQILNVDVDAFLFLAPIISYRFHTQVEDYALPATGFTSKIAKLLLKSKFKLFGLITVSKDVYNKTAYAPGYQIPVDGAPGSKYDFSNFDAPGAGPVPAFNVIAPIPAIFGIIGYLYAYSSGGTPTNSAFVSVGSALDVSPYNSSTLTQKFVSGTNPNYRSTAAAYIAQEPFVQKGVTLYNNYHWTYTARNSRWIFNRMQGIADNLNCSSSCSPAYSISGNDVLCSGSTYSIPGLASNATVTWSATSGVVNINSSTGYATPGSGGSAYITASISSPCTPSPVSISKQITAGAPNNYYIQRIYVYPNPPAVDVYTGSTGNSQVATSWSISVNRDGGTRSDNGYPPAVTTVNGGSQCGNYTVTLTANNSCGSYSTSSTFTRPGCRMVHLTPNPATGYVIITDEDASPNSTRSTAKVLITVFDKANRPLKQSSFTQSNQYRFSLDGLLPGTYTVQIKQNDFVKNLNLVKQ